MVGNQTRAYLRNKKAKILRICQMLRRMCSAEYRGLKHSKEQRRMILLDTPEHGNLGDHAIAYVQRLFLEERVRPEAIFEFTNQDWCLLRSHLASLIRKEDAIVIPGGGFVGSLWEREEAVIIDIMETLAEHSIIIFPQTVFFSRDQKGVEELSRFRNAVKACKDITIFARDEMSYALLRNEIGMREHGCFLVPDIVTYYKPLLSVDRDKKILQVFRKDIEKTASVPPLEFLKSERFQEYILEESDTVLDHNVSREDREHELHQKLSEFASAALVITDRLHGMIFAAITGTPCIALDNLSRKVSGQYVWFQYLPYVRLVQADEISEELVDEMLSLKPQGYSNAELSGAYELMAAVIREKQEGVAFDG